MRTTNEAMRLIFLLDLYLATRDASKAYRNCLRRTLAKAELCGISSVADLQPDQVNKFLASLSSAAVTRQNVRRELLTLWRYAFEEGMTEVPPMRVMRIRAAQRPVEAWSLDQLRQLLDCAEKDQTRIGGVHNRRTCDWMPGWIVIAYDTGLRLGDLLALKSKNLRNGCISATAHKTGKALARPLSTYGQEWATRLVKQSPDGSLFSWFLTRRRALVTVRKFLDRHGFEGSSKYLRRSCATYVEASRPGEAWRYLQHSTPNLVPRHYADASLLAVPSGPPPIR